MSGGRVRLPVAVAGPLGAALLALPLLLLPGCGRDEGRPAPEAAQAEAARPARDHVERGPVSLTVTAGRDRVGVGERLELTVEVLAETGVDVTMPQIGETLGDFEIRAAQTPPDVPLGTHRRWRHAYTLSTYDSGSLEVPALTASFVDRRDAPEARDDDGRPVQGELTAGPLAVDVQSLIGDEVDPSAFADIKGAVEVQAPWRLSWPALAVATAAAALLLAVLWLAWRRRAAAAGPAPGVVLPAHVWAARELERLEADGLVERGELHEFFFRLSTIVRQYIERRFAISAPERTTEEFIREMRGHPALSGEQQDLLRDFLRSADMVKFALHRPPREEARSALASARGFVSQTAAGAETPAGGEVAA